jgi:hypothetical protein
MGEYRLSELARQQIKIAVLGGLADLERDLIRTHRRRPRPRQIARPAYGATAENDDGAEAGSAA